MADKAKVLSKTETITSQWKEFAKTEAYKEFMEYIDLQDFLAIQGAKGTVYTLTEDSEDDFAFNKENAAFLLQRSVMCDIVKMYVNGYVNPEALNK